MDVLSRMCKREIVIISKSATMIADFFGNSARVG